MTGRLRSVGIRLLVATFVVVAITAQVGEKSASAASVQSLAATATSSGSITVTWDQPSGADADDYSYKVYYRASGSWSSQGTGVGVESKVISGLTGGTTYEFQVTATPAAGAGCTTANVGVEEGLCRGRVNPNRKCTDHHCCCRNSAKCANRNRCYGIVGASVGCLQRWCNQRCIGD